MIKAAQKRDCGSKVAYVELAICHFAFTKKDKKTREEIKVKAPYNWDVFWGACPCVAHASGHKKNVLLLNPNNGASISPPCSCCVCIYSQELIKEHVMCTCHIQLCGWACIFAKWKLPFLSDKTLNKKEKMVIICRYLFFIDTYLACLIFPSFVFRLKVFFCLKLGNELKCY